MLLVGLLVHIYFYYKASIIWLNKMESTKQYNKVVVIARVDPVKKRESSFSLFYDK